MAQEAQQTQQVSQSCEENVSTLSILSIALCMFLTTKVQCQSIIIVNQAKKHNFPVFFPFDLMEKLFVFFLFQ